MRKKIRKIFNYTNVDNVNQFTGEAILIDKITDKLKN
jgi:hypothetical protein